MAQQLIGIGTTANDGTGDPIRTAFDKVNDNMTELYSGQSLSIVSDTLTLTRADGTTSTVDLSAYLDEDSRSIASGTLNAATGIVTFTRDDFSTFTLDLSGLLDDTNIITSVNTQTGAVVLDADDIDDSATTNKFTSAADISKLAGIEAGADITDATNVEAAGALMDSEVTDLAGIKAVTISTLQPKPTEGAFVDGDKTKLDGIAAGAEVNTVDSVNTQTGAVVLDSDDIAEGTTNLYDKTVSLTQGSNISITGTYPSFTIAAQNLVTDSSGQALAAPTSLTLVTNTLTLTKGDGTTDTVDLTPYLDEDARAIASGVLNASTGIVTFTRDDATTFTLDLSALLDDTNLVTSVNGASGVVVLNTDNIAQGSTNLYDKTVTLTGSGATSVSGTYPNFTISSTDTNTQLSTEQVQDIIGAMVSGNTETNITVTYDDVTGKLNFAADSTSVSDFMTNGANNRIVTATGTDGQNAEATLTYDGVKLTVGGDIEIGTAYALKVGSSIIAGTNSSGIFTYGDGMLQIDPAIFNISFGGMPLFYGTINSGYLPVAGAAGFSDSSIHDQYGQASIGTTTKAGNFSVSGVSTIQGPIWGSSMFMDNNGLIIGVSSSLPPNGLVAPSVLITSADLHAVGDVIAASTTPSDEKLKDNIETIDNALSKVEQLRGVSFTWKEGNRKGQKEIGVIAQEVEQVFPEIVREKEMPLIDGDTYKTVDYEKIIGVLIEAVKELSNKVEKLENK